MGFNSETGRINGLKTRKKTPKEREEYIRFYIEKLSSGYGRRKAVDTFKEVFNVNNEETAQRYYNKAIERFKEVGNEEAAAAKAIMRERLTDIYEKAYEGKNYKIALQTLKQIAELDGLDAPTKTELNIETNAEFNFE